MTHSSPVIDRFTTALYTVPEAAGYLGLPASTFRSWASGYRARRPTGDVVGAAVITRLDAPRGAATIPFVGLAEGYALAAMRRAGVPLQRVRPALETLSAELGIEHALASKRLFTDGAEVLFDYAEKIDEPNGALRELVVVRNGQRVFQEVVEQYLRQITFGSDGYATVLPLLGFRTAQVVADAGRAFGQPIFQRGGARLEDALALFGAGEPLSVVAEEYGMPVDELEDAIRYALHTAA